VSDLSPYRDGHALVPDAAALLPDRSDSTQWRRPHLNAAPPTSCVPLHVLSQACVCCLVQLWVVALDVPWLLRLRGMPTHTHQQECCLQLCQSGTGRPPGGSSKGAQGQPAE
jgi:hypothetical protein